MSWSALLHSAVSLRRALHQRPELPWQERETAAVIRRQLSALDIPWQACASTGTVATLAKQAGGAAIALRADIDALPIDEDSAHAYRSVHPGCMHACGHDGHTATLMATIWWLKQHEALLPQPVVLLFQPAEEGGHGAREMIRDGALEGVSCIYGWHNWPAIPFGQAVCPDGPVMSANGTFHITVRGRGGHASQPEQCCDPVLATAAITQALQQLVSRRLPPQQATVVSVTQLHADSSDTVIPDQATLGGSIRLADHRLRGQVEQLIRQIAEDTARAHGVSAEVQCFPRYGATVNHPLAAASYRTALEQELGAAWRSRDTLLPIMASEDFSYYLDVIPGAFALLGAGNGNEVNEPCHSPRYDFNDNLVAPMARIFCRLVGAPLPRDDD